MMIINHEQALNTADNRTAFPFILLLSQVIFHSLSSVHKLQIPSQHPFWLLEADLAGPPHTSLAAPSQSFLLVLFISLTSRTWSLPTVPGPPLFSIFTHLFGDLTQSHGFKYHLMGCVSLHFPPEPQMYISSCLLNISTWITNRHLRFNNSKTNS